MPLQSRMSGPRRREARPEALGTRDDLGAHRPVRRQVLHINAGQALSVQYHNEKDETVHLLSGELVYWVKVDGELRDMQLESGRVVPHHAGHRALHGSGHRLRRARGGTPELDDVVRLKDRYGREGTSAP